MAVNIDEMHVETQQKPAAPEAEAKGGPGSKPRDLKCEMETLRERDLRLQAD